MTQKIYVLLPKDYEGELNLHAMERRIIIRELKLTQNVNDAGLLLELSLRTVFRKIIAHQIKKSEWMAPKLQKVQKFHVPKAIKLKPWKNT